MNQWTKRTRLYRAKDKGFTITELLIVIAVIAILATITVVAYSGIQNQAHNIRRLDDIDKVSSLLEIYARSNDGLYPATTNNDKANWKTVDVRTDSNCFNGSAQADWIPDLGPLPQSYPNTGSMAGADGKTGCYLYASNGKDYVLSAWNMVAMPTDSSPFYKRLGFRSFQTSTSTQFYTCNDNVIGGANGGSYDITKDYYKHSYTISNITNCDQTPPPGA